ncbi:MAG: hypothetical protein ABIH38_01120 [Patescibacteria group bacterium]
MAKVYIVTHGSKYPGGDPAMTDEGFEQIRALVGHLPKHPSEVICGTGLRHRDVAEALGLAITCYNALVGRPESLEKDGTVSLADCKSIPRTMYDKRGMKEALLVLLSSLPDNAVICGGRPMLNDIGGKGESAAVYTWENGTFTKIAAYGDIGGGEKEV